MQNCFMEGTSQQGESNKLPPQSFQPMQQRKAGNKVFFILVGLILLVLFTFGTFFLSRRSLSSNQTLKIVTMPASLIPRMSPNSAPTTTVEVTGWKTFNGLYGVLFQYPPEWNLVSMDSLHVTKQVLFEDGTYGEGSCRGDCPVFEITFLVSDNPEHLTLTDFIKSDYIQSGNSQYLAPLKVEDYVIPEGLVFKKATGIFNGLEYFYIQHNKTIYTISVFAGANGTSDDINDPKIQARLLVLHKVLSTFQFTTK